MTIVISEFWLGVLATISIEVSVIFIIMVLRQFGADMRGNENDK